MSALPVCPALCSNFTNMLCIICVHKSPTYPPKKHVNIRVTSLSRAVYFKKKKLGVQKKSPTYLQGQKNVNIGVTSLSRPMYSYN